MGRRTVGGTGVGNRRVAGVRQRLALFADISISITTTPSTAHAAAVPDGAFSAIRVRGVLAKSAATVATLTCTVSERPPIQANPIVPLTTTAIDVLGDGPDDWVAVDALLPLPDTTANGNSYLFQFSVDSGTATFHGPVIEAVP